MEIWLRQEWFDQTPIEKMVLYIWNMYQDLRKCGEHIIEMNSGHIGEEK